MNLFWIGSEGIYFVNLGSKVIESRFYFIFYLLYNKLIVGLMNSVL